MTQHAVAWRRLLPGNKGFSGGLVNTKSRVKNFCGNTHNQGISTVSTADWNNSMNNNFNKPEERSRC